MIEIKNVSKVFFRRTPQRNKWRALFRPKQEPFHALENVNLNIARGEIFVLLGPNGAGKTTLIKILCGLMRPTAGEVHIQGKPVKEVQQKLGLMLGFSMIYYRLTGYDNLKYFAKLYGISDCEERLSALAEALELGEWMDEYVEHYSTGMKSKLALARALIHDPEMIVLDEPTAGLDPSTALEIRKKIKQMGKTVVLTTHNLPEAEDLATTIAFLNDGKIQAVQKEWSNLEDFYLKALERKRA